MNNAGPHILYRCYATAGELLYIGITNDPNNRFNLHARKSPWWREVVEIALDSDHASRADLEDAERAAIGAEAPRYNVEHNVNRPPARPEEMQQMRDAMNKLGALLGLEECEQAS